MKALLTTLALALATPIQACEVALALTIDVSGSIDPDEYALQMDGLADALSDPTVADALVKARAEVLVMQWSGSSRQDISIGWRRISVQEDVSELAQDIRKLPRRWRNFSTAIGEALLHAANAFGQVPHCRRRVIDVSGDGRSNEGIEVETARQSLVRSGITINGLAIETGDEDLKGYFRDHVIGGSGAFVIRAEGYEDYPRAIRRKLLDEITKPVT